MKHAIDSNLSLVGELNGSAKLTENSVREIRKLKGTMTNEEMGKKFGVHSTNISLIINYKAWKHV